MVEKINFKNGSFNKIKLPSSETLNIDWGRMKDKLASSMHSISSHLDIFTPTMFKYFIEKYTNKSDLIFDPFFGGDITTLKTKKMNKRFIDLDLNFYALILSRTKIGKSFKNNNKNLYKLKFDSYIKFISKFLNNFYPKIKIGRYTAIVIGDVHDKNLLEKK